MPAPTIPPPKHRLIPTINIAKATGWPEGRTPKPADGLAVSAFAAGLDHPRWLYVLPNGDVLVAESNTPKQEGGSGGIKTMVMGWAMQWAGAGVPSPNRIILLRDADSDGVRRPADCDDTNPLFRPGVTDVFDNGIDENCDGVDAVNTDRDEQAGSQQQ